MTAVVTMSDRKPVAKRGTSGKKLVAKRGSTVHYTQSNMTGVQCGFIAELPKQFKAGQHNARKYLPPKSAVGEAIIGLAVGESKVAVMDNGAHVTITVTKIVPRGGKVVSHTPEVEHDLKIAA